MSQAKCLFNKELNDSIPPVLVDTDHISQALINILVNALDSMPNGGELTIKTDACKKHGECVTVSIADTGCGIRDVNIDKIFEPFLPRRIKRVKRDLGWDWLFQRELSRITMEKSL